MKRLYNTAERIPANSLIECFKPNIHVSAKSFIDNEPKDPFAKGFHYDILDCIFFGDAPTEEFIKKPVENSALSLVPKHVDAKDIALAFLESKMKIWSKDKNEWEKDSYTLHSSGNFIDDKGNLSSKESHTAYVTLEDALEAIEVYLMNMDEIN